MWEVRERDCWMSHVGQTNKVLSTQIMQVWCIYGRITGKPLQAMQKNCSKSIISSVDSLSVLVRLFLEGSAWHRMLLHPPVLVLWKCSLTCVQACGCKGWPGSTWSATCTAGKRNISLSMHKLLPCIDTWYVLFLSNNKYYEDSTLFFAITMSLYNLVTYHISSIRHRLRLVASLE